MKTLVVVNPQSANRSTGRRWPTIREALLKNIGPFEERFTSAPGHATDLAREGLTKGVERIISVGGDGTNNELLNGFFDGTTPIRKEALLGFVPQGTGGDLRKTLGIGKDIRESLAVLTSGHIRPADVGLVNFTNHAGSRARRLFINITSFGIGGLVDARVNQSSKALGGKISFLIGTLRALAVFRNQLVRLKVSAPNGKVELDEELLVNNVAVANGQYFGGGMWVAPKAEIDDGLFDVIILGNLSRAEVIFKAPRIYRGKHLSLPKVRSLRGAQVEASGAGEVLIDMDGEQPGRLPITLDILPKAIQLIAP